MPRPSNDRGFARYSCQVWRCHFLNADWFQALDDAAFETLSGRIFTVRDFWPESSLGEIQCEVRSLTDEEAGWNGRPFAKQAYVCLDFVLRNTDEAGLRAQLEAQNDFSDPSDIVELAEYAKVSLLEMFCDIIIFLSNVAYCGVLGSELKSVSIADRVLVRSNRGHIGLPRSVDNYDFLTSGVRPEVTLDEILSWSRKCNGIWSGKAKASVEKVMSFLSHTFDGSNRDEVAALLWATAGLEAIACGGEDSKRKQLKLRMPQVCGLMPFANAAKTVVDGYDFRSRLFHGDIPTINSFAPDDIGWGKDRYDYKISDYSVAFQMMLIAAVWKSIKLDANHITFQETAEFSRVVTT